jgi:hypothetical protein
MDSLWLLNVEVGARQNVICSRLDLFDSHFLRNELSSIFCADTTSKLGEVLPPSLELRRGKRRAALLGMTTRWVLPTFSKNPHRLGTAGLANRARDAAGEDGAESKQSKVGRDRSLPAVVGARC